MTGVDTVQDLVDELQCLIDEGKGDMPLRMAHQPSWPLAEQVTNIGEANSNDGTPTIWLACNATYRGENPYAPRGAWDERW